MCQTQCWECKDEDAIFGIQAPGLLESYAHSPSWNYSQVASDWGRVTGVMSGENLGYPEGQNKVMGFNDSLSGSKGQCSG